MELFYPCSLAHARERGEEEAWVRSRNLTLSLKDEIDKKITECYDPVYGKLKAGTAHALIEKYGEERTAYVLSLTIGEHLWDGRFSLDNRSWAVGVGAYFKDMDDAFGFDHLLTSSRPAIDQFTGEFRKETGYDPSLSLIGTEKEPDSFVYKDSYASAVFADELPQYLWSWGLDKKCAASLEDLIREENPDGLYEVISTFGADRVTFVLTSTADAYRNSKALSHKNREALFELTYWVPDFSVAEQEGYRLSVAPAALDEFLNEAVPVLKRCRTVPRIRERQVLDEETPPGAFSYAVYQIGDAPCSYRFEGRAYLLENNIRVDPADYQFIYSGSKKPMRTEREALDDLFRELNVHRPENFKGRSLSVSDVIVLNHDYVRRAYYIDDTGYLLLPDFVRERRAFTEKQEYGRDCTEEEEEKLQVR